MVVSVSKIFVNPQRYIWNVYGFRLSSQTDSRKAHRNRAVEAILPCMKELLWRGNAYEPARVLIVSAHAQERLLSTRAKFLIAVIARKERAWFWFISKSCQISCKDTLKALFLHSHHYVYSFFDLRIYWGSWIRETMQNVAASPWARKFSLETW